MKPVNIDGHSAYQNRVLTQLHKYYPDAVTSLFPSDMLRAILVSVEFKINSYTRLAADLKENHLHAIISGFTVSDTPGVGTFYDFHRRLWLSEKWMRYINNTINIIIY